MDERDKKLENLLIYIHRNKDNGNLIQLEPTDLVEQLCDEGFLKCHGGKSGFADKLMYSVYYTLDVAISQGGRLSYLNKNSQRTSVSSIVGNNNQVIFGDKNNASQTSQDSLKTTNTKLPSKARGIIKEIFIGLIVTIIGGLIIYYLTK